MNTKTFSLEAHIPKKDILDARTLLAVNIGVSLLMFSASRAVLGSAFCIALTVMLLFRMGTAALKYTIAFTVCCAASASVLLQPQFPALKGLLTIVGFLGFMTSKIFPLIMIAHTVIRKVNSNVLVCALRKMRLHKGFVLALTVALRFLPTARQEVQLIKECMKMRGIELTFKRFLKSPALIIEYSLVPLLFRSVKISEEMTAAALVKGVEYPGEKTSLTDVRLTVFDWAFFCTAVCIMAVSFLYGTRIEAAVGNGMSLVYHLVVQGGRL